MANPSILLNTTPSDWYNAILLQINEWLAILLQLNQILSTLPQWQAIFPNFLHSLSLQLNQILLTLPQWLAIFPNFLHSLSLQLNQILSTLAQSLTLAAPYILASLAVILICGWSGRGSVKMMKAPGTAGKVIMPRAAFVANPKAYFAGFRASK